MGVDDIAGVDANEDDGKELTSDEVVDDDGRIECWFDTKDDVEEAKVEGAVVGDEDSDAATDDDNDSAEAIAASDIITDDDSGDATADVDATDVDVDDENEAEADGAGKAASDGRGEPGGARSD